jgi:hypothetical protein
MEKTGVVCNLEAQAVTVTRLVWRFFIPTHGCAMLPGATFCYRWEFNQCAKPLDALACSTDCPVQGSNGLQQMSWIQRIQKRDSCGNPEIT